MRICDLHCDTLFFKKPLFQNQFAVDFERMKRYEEYTQFFAVCQNPEEKSLEGVLEYAAFFREELAKIQIPLCTNQKELARCHQEGKPALFLSLEGGGMLHDRFDLEQLFEAGFRMLSLTWNKKNQLAGGADDPDAGLTELGAKLAETMEQLGGMVDLSHLNDRSFWEVCEVLKKPLVASHSNSRAICPHRRNLTDQQFLKICESGGCVGLNLYPPFLSEKREVQLSDMMEHIRHFALLGGEDQIGLGCDFDGTDSLPADCIGIQDLEKISEIPGISRELTEKITHKNVLHVLEICL